MLKKRATYLIILALITTTVTALNPGLINVFVPETIPPTFFNVNSNVSSYMVNEAISHNILWFDDTELMRNYFETNITGNSANTTTDLSGRNQFVNITNKPIYPGKYYWKSYTQDFSGNWNSTNEMFTIITEATTTTSTTTIEFTPSAQQSPSVSSSGSSGSKTVTSDFFVNVNLIESKLKQGEVNREIITIINIGDTTLDIEIDPQELRRFIIISEDSFRLKPKEVKTIVIDIFAREKEIEDAYTGKILVKSDNIVKTVNVIVEVISKKALFDIKTKVFNNEISIGESVKADITLINFGDLKPVDVALFYAIKDFNDNLIKLKEETLAVGTELTVARELEIPKDTPIGNYIFYTRVRYNGEFDIDGDLIKVIDKRQLQFPRSIIKKVKPNYIYAILLVLITLAILEIIHHHTKKGRSKKKKH